MYLWVARMIMMGLHFEAEIPFEKVNVHSIVLAEDGTKMSRSKGNTIDPLELFDEYGTDAVRFGLLYQSSTQDFALLPRAGRDGPRLRHQAVERHALRTLLPRA